MLKVTCAIIIHRNKILVAQRNANSDHSLKWEFPGGKINTDEKPDASISREIKEELEIDIEIIEKMTSANYDYGFKKIQLIPFLCIIKSGEINLTEHLAFKWVSIEELYEVDFSEADIKLIQQHQNKIILKKYLGENMHNAG